MFPTLSIACFIDILFRSLKPTAPNDEIQFVDKPLLHQLKNTSNTYKVFEQNEKIENFEKNPMEYDDVPKENEYDETPGPSGNIAEYFSKEGSSRQSSRHEYYSEQSTVYENYALRQLFDESHENVKNTKILTKNGQSIGILARGKPIYTELDIF